MSPLPVDRVLDDPHLDALLRRDGFVTFRLVSRRDAGALREAYGRRRGWSGAGFQSDFALDEPDVRREVSQEISEALDEPVRRRFVGYTPFLRNYLVKFPGEESDLYVHRDWMYVDESVGHRTFVAWVALEDITGHNGQLRVLRRSHEIDSMLRGTGLTAPWLEHLDVIESRLLSVPVEAGECIVFDNRLVHASFPNNTSEPRVAAAVGMRPSGTQLVHYRRAEPDLAVRYDVDEDFFCTATPSGLLDAPPELPVVAQLTTGVRKLTARELASELDAGPIAKVDRVRHMAHVLGNQAVSAVQRGRETLAEAVTKRPSAPTRGQRRWRLPTPGAAGTARATDGIEGQSLRERVAAQIDDLPTKAAIVVLGTNEAIINRFAPPTPAVWDPTQFEWARRIEAGYPRIRSEVEALLEGPSEIPQIEEVTGGIPQGNVGQWRSFVLMHQGRWMDWNCVKCPETTALVKQIPGLTMAGFSVLHPGTHITEHRGPNKGALRYQLGVVVPGQPGDCRIRVGEEMLVWRDGEGVMFDFTIPHEAWNDSDSLRVLLMLEVVSPLPWYLAPTNRAAQRAMGWFPTTRDMKRRLKDLEPSLQRVG